MPSHHTTPVTHILHLLNINQSISLTIIQGHHIRQGAVIRHAQICIEKRNIFSVCQSHSVVLGVVQSLACRGKQCHSPLFWHVATLMHGELHSLLILCCNTASCRSFTFFSSLLHCCRRLFFWGLLRFPSRESLRAASYICSWRAKPVSSSCNCGSYNEDKFLTFSLIWWIIVSFAQPLCLINNSTHWLRTVPLYPDV